MLQNKTLTVMRKGRNGQPCSSAPASAGPEPEEEEGEDGKSNVMAKSVSGAAVTAVPPDVASALSGAQGHGESLPSETRSVMELRFGSDFSSVRIHADRQSDTLNHGLNAEAFTLGSDIYFRAGRYASSTHEGRMLLAHELTHVIQQRDDPCRIQRFSLSGFSTTQASAMRTAIPLASSTVRSCRNTWRGRRVANKIDSANYIYDAESGSCAWTRGNPLADIRISPHAFNSGECCKLESTIAHEAWHTWFGWESGSNQLECSCFGCSC